ncbi:hypothetical protein DPMN_058521 [Dreissena polymorpha]|uniref:Uncharacterized protein n=1 Tax=Dreissena polymorpha TaxID=45954 RepID=A0A9D4C1X2_DREPO|nr:hypothetical protein DPMN_058521 [Dreissena polymorpha]
MEVDANECNNADDLVMTRVYRAARFTKAVATERMRVQGSRSATLAESQTAAGTSRRQKNLHEKTRRPASPGTSSISRERISAWNRDSDNFAIPRSPEENDTGSEKGAYGDTSLDLATLHAYLNWIQLFEYSQTAAETSRRQNNLHERTQRPVSPETWAMSRERTSSWNRDSENFAIPQSPEESDTGSEVGDYGDAGLDLAILY